MGGVIKITGEEMGLETRYRTAKVGLARTVSRTYGTSSKAPENKGYNV